ncbi:MAG: inositol monophosphatase family protein [Planctomycetota bacterium]
MNASEVESRYRLAQQLCIEAGKSTLRYFQTDGFEVEKKGDGSPLTVADREAETLIRKKVQSEFPDDTIVGEEFGTTEGTSEFGWILDPIDGTKSFISGVPLYGTMIAVEHCDRRKSETRKAILGAVYFPGLDVGIHACRGKGAWAFEGQKTPQRANVSEQTDLSESVFVTSGMEGFYDRKAQELYHELSSRVYFSRTWGDVYGYYLVATGKLELMIDPILNVWDAAAVQPIIEEAGGQFTDWNGTSCIDGGDAVGSNGRVHSEVIEILKRAPRQTG